MFAIVHDTFENGRLPLVRHIFVGETRERARDVYDAHRKSDAFVRECDDRGVYAGRVTCRTHTSMTKLSSRQISALERGQLAGAAEAGPPAPCPSTHHVSFWRFAAPVIAGSAAARGASWLAGKAFADYPDAQKTATIFAGIGAFWLTSGLLWAVLTRRPTP